MCIVTRAQETTGPVDSNRPGSLRVSLSEVVVWLLVNRRLRGEIDAFTGFFATLCGRHARRGRTSQSIGLHGGACGQSVCILLHKRGLANFLEHIVIDKSDGVFRRILITPDDPGAFKASLDDALERFRATTG